MNQILNQTIGGLFEGMWNVHCNVYLNKTQKNSSVTTALKKTKKNTFLEKFNGACLCRAPQYDDRVLWVAVRALLSSS